MKEDLRVIKTKQAVEQAFISLIEEKGFENVKIIDIAKRANVNRNTIYLHYSSKEMIIEDLVERTFSSSFNKVDAKSYLKLRTNKKKMSEMFRAIFDLVNDQIELYRIILTDQNLYGYLSLQQRKIKTFIMEYLKPALKNEIIVEYAVSGIFGIFRNWIIYDKGTIDENVALITELAISNMRHVQFK